MRLEKPRPLGIIEIAFSHLLLERMVLRLQLVQRLGPLPGQFLSLKKKEKEKKKKERRIEKRRKGEKIDCVSPCF